MGIQLGLTPDELDIIRANCMDVEECLRKVLQRWHDKVTNPTWQEVVTALRAMDEIKIAKEIELLKITFADKGNVLPFSVLSYTKEINNCGYSGSSLITLVSLSPLPQCHLNL